MILGLQKKGYRVAYRFPLLAFAIAILFASNGCATDPPKSTTKEIIQQAINEHAHQDSFVKVWGPPTGAMTLKSGETVWVWEYRNTSYFQGTGSSYCMSHILTFDQDGGLEDWQKRAC